MKVTCFLPCRKGSERIENKNIRPFGKYPYGLIEIKLNQLSQVAAIEKIVLSTNDEEIIDYAASLNIKKLKVHRRDNDLCTGLTSTDTLIQHAVSLIPDDHILWTHVTSPFLNSESYQSLIEAYKAALDSGYDSLMTATEIKGFIWNEQRPLNYDRNIEKWPRTQTIQPLYEINSGAFLCHADIYKKHQDRIGDRPKLYSTNKFEGFDIDWTEDFSIAECLLNEGIAKL